MKLDHIAIVRLSALGDIVNATIVLQFIKQKYPDIKIDWITEEVFAPLLYEHPFIHKVHTINLKKIKKEKVSWPDALMREAITGEKIRKLKEGL